MFQEVIHLLLVWANFVAICQSVRQDIDERIIGSLAADFQFQLNKLITRVIWTGFYSNIQKYNFYFKIKNIFP